LFLVYLGVRTILDSNRAAPAGAAVAPARGALQGFASTFGLTLTNPMTILSFAAIFAAAGLVGPGAGPANASWMVLGVFLGSAAWWLTLVFLVGLLRERFGRSLQVWAGRISGVALLGFGLLALASPFLPAAKP
jgi:threonine/homoserine/homoserine lactone efflux protein